METETDTAVDLVYFSGCPNVDEARASLRSALTQLGLEARWQEWNLDSADTPHRVRGYASPAILIDGKHLYGDEPMPDGAQACSASGAPTAAEIVEMLDGQA